MPHCADLESMAAVSYTHLDVYKRQLQMCGLPSAHLLIVGDGPDAGAIRSSAAARGVSERVHFLGQVHDQGKYQALAAADVFVSVSQHEGCLLYTSRCV